MHESDFDKTSSEIKPETLFREHYTRLCHFAFTLLNKKELVEDIVQDAFIAFWNNQSIVADHPIAIKNYLYSAVRNACLNLYRHEKVQERYLMLYQQEAVEEPKILQAMIRSEVLHEINKAISELPSSCQRIFRMGYLEGLTNHQIAETLSISINTVKTQKQRAIKSLKSTLNPEIFGLLLLFSSTY